MKYHWMTFMMPEAANVFPQKAQGIRSFIMMNGVQEKTVYLSSDKPLAPAQIRHVKAEAEANFGILSATKFNLAVSAVPLCGDCGTVLQENEIEDGFCAACLAGAVGE